MYSLSNSPFLKQDGCREFSINTKGARLFYVVPADGGAAYWRAELILNGDERIRRFSSEAYARWWLAFLEEPRAVASTYDYEERNSILSPSQA